MARRDKIHEIVVKSLEKDNWTITHDPFRVEIEEGDKSLEMDLGAEKFVTAKKGVDKIIVEIKSFLDLSVINDFHDALGKYLSYRSALNQQNIERDLYLAISLIAYKRMKRLSYITTILREYNVNLIVVNTNTIRIETWIK